MNTAGARRLAAVQLAPVIGDPYGNRRWALRAADDALRAGADLVVLPALATSGAVFASRDEAAEAAISRHDPYFDQLADLLIGTDRVIVIGFAEVDHGVLFDAAAVVAASGVLAVHRTTLLWERAQQWFAPGSAPAPVVDVGWCRLGVLIDDELECPGATRALAREGADVVAVPTNRALAERPAETSAPEVSAAQAAARTDSVVVVRADRAGRERGRAWAQRSAVIDRDGWLAAAAEPGDVTRTAEDLAAFDERPPLVTADMDLQSGAGERTELRRDPSRRRRPELHPST